MRDIESANNGKFPSVKPSISDLDNKTTDPAFTWIIQGRCHVTFFYEGVALVKFVSLFATVCFQMFAQRVCTREGIVALVAFVCPFSTVCFQMSPQSRCMSRCIITLVAFV